MEPVILSAFVLSSNIGNKCANPSLPTLWCQCHRLWPAVFTIDRYSHQGTAPVGLAFGQEIGMKKPWHQGKVLLVAQKRFPFLRIVAFVALAPRKVLVLLQWWVVTLLASTNKVCRIEYWVCFPNCAVWIKTVSKTHRPQMQRHGASSSLTVSHPTEVTPNHPNNLSSNAKPEPSYAQAVAAASQRLNLHKVLRVIETSSTNKCRKLNLPTFWQLDSCTVKSFCAHRDDETTSSTEKLQMHGGKKLAMKPFIKGLITCPSSPPNKSLAAKSAYFFCVCGCICDIPTLVTNTI